MPHPGGRSVADDVALQLQRGHLSEELQCNGPMLTPPQR